MDVPSITIGNDPIHSASAEANVELEKPGFLFKKDSALANSTAKLVNYDVLFKFRLREDKGV